MAIVSADRSRVVICTLSWYERRSPRSLPMHRGLWLRRVGSVLLVFFALNGAIRGERPAPLAPLQFLIGEWEGIGDQAGATGGFTFAPGVQDRVIVRTNYSNTPAIGGKPASRHDDLMVIYIDVGVV